VKILYVNDFEVRGGAEVFVHQLASYMESKGHEVYFAFGDTKGGDRLFKIDRIKGKLIRERTVYWNVNDPLVYQQMKHILRSVKPDIIHLNNLMLLTLAPLIAAKEFQVPRVISVHDYWPVCPRRSLLRPHDEVCTENNWGTCFHCAGVGHPFWLVKLVATHCSALANKLFERKMKECYRLLKDEMLVCASRFVRDIFVRFGYSEHNLQVIPYGIETNLFRPSFNFTDTLLWVGRIASLKGLEYFVKAADIVKVKYPSTQFTVIGKHAIDSMYGYKKVPISSAIKSIGELPRKELVEYYSNSLALVITSVWPEPFGIVALEAMACGKPVIAFESGGLNDIIKNGKTGFLIKPKDHLAIADKIMTLLGDKKLAIKIGRDARKLIERSYAIERMYTNYEKTYTATIDK